MNYVVEKHVKYPCGITLILYLRYVKKGILIDQTITV